VPALSSSSPAAGRLADPAAPVVEAVYTTDPLCAWSWGFEPQLRRLRYAFGAALGWRTRMAGLVPSWDTFSDPVHAVSRPLQMGPLWYQVRHTTGQPLDDRLWHEDPPASSYPACLAVKAAGLQSAEAGEAVLRRLREAATTERQNVADVGVLRTLAREVAEATPDLLDADRFAADLDGSEAEAAFRDDLREARYLGLGRTPALTLRRAVGAIDGQGKTLLLVGYRPYDALRRALAHLAPDLEPERPAPTADAYVAFWGGTTDRELDEALSPHLSPPSSAPEVVP
jgi:predicted DsbA family dithiol-disulfide isomerase